MIIVNVPVLLHRGPQRDTEGHRGRYKKRKSEISFIKYFVKLFRGKLNRVVLAFGLLYQIMKIG